MNICFENWIDKHYGQKKKKKSKRWEDQVYKYLVH